VVDYLQKKHSFTHMSVRRLLMQIIKDRQMKVDRDSMTTVANSLRAEGGPAIIVEKMLTEALREKKNCIIESIRTPAEAALLQKFGAQLISVDADVNTRYVPPLVHTSAIKSDNLPLFLGSVYDTYYVARSRYDRVVLRGSETDKISLEKFKQDEEREWSNTDPNKQVRVDPL